MTWLMMMWVMMMMIMMMMMMMMMMIDDEDEYVGNAIGQVGSCEVLSFLGSPSHG